MRTVAVDVTVTELPRYGTVKGIATVLLVVMVMNCSKSPLLLQVLPVQETAVGIVTEDVLTQ